MFVYMKKILWKKKKFISLSIWDIGDFWEILVLFVLVFDWRGIFIFTIFSLFIIVVLLVFLVVGVMFDWNG